MKFWPQGSERPNPHTHAYGNREGGREDIGVPEEAARGQYNFRNLENRGGPLAKFWWPGTGGGWTHASYTPTPLPAWNSSATTPSNARLPARGVVSIGGGGGGATGVAVPVHRPCGPSPV